MKAPTWQHRLSTTLLACLLAACSIAGCSAVRAQEAGGTLLLVAAPTLQGPYSQTTLVAVPVGGKHLGFILNRATGLKLSALFPGQAAWAVVSEPLYIGGPEMNESLFAVVRRNPGEHSLQLFGDLFVTGRSEAIDRIVAQTPNDARFFAGFVGWQQGELENEIARGLWYVTEPDAGLVFRSDTSGMWEELVTRLDGQRLPRRNRNLLQTRFQP